MANDSTAGPLAITIGDGDTPAEKPYAHRQFLRLTPSAITFGGTGPNRTVTVQSGSRVGSSKITLTVTDGGQTASASFIVNVA